MFLACLSLNQAQIRPRNGQVSKPGKLCPAVKCLRCCANVKYGGHLTAAGNACASRKREMLPLATLWKRAVMAHLYLLQHRTKPKNRPRNGQVSKPTKNRRMFSVGLFVGA